MVYTFHCNSWDNDLYISDINVLKSICCLLPKIKNGTAAIVFVFVSISSKFIHVKKRIIFFAWTAIKFFAFLMKLDYMDNNDASSG